MPWYFCLLFLSFSIDFSFLLERYDPFSTPPCENKTYPIFVSTTHSYHERRPLESARRFCLSMSRVNLEPQFTISTTSPNPT